MTGSDWIKESRRKKEWTGQVGPCTTKAKNKHVVYLRSKFIGGCPRQHRVRLGEWY